MSTNKPLWKGTLPEYRELLRAIRRECKVASKKCTCPSHLMLRDQRSLDYLLANHHWRAWLNASEFSRDTPFWTAA